MMDEDKPDPMPFSLEIERLEASGLLRHIELHEMLPSTNDLAIVRAADATLKTPALFVALEQTAGRGRGDNAWWSSDGALMFSLLLEPHRVGIPADRLPCVSLAVAVAICDTIEGLTPEMTGGVKWPNDVYLGDRKLAGVLIECPNTSGQTPPRLVIGIGINVNNSLATAPAEVRSVGVSLCEVIGRELDGTDLLLNLLQALRSRLVQLARDDPQLAEAWRERSILSGRHVEILDGSRKITGEVVEIAEDGALVVQTPDGPTRCYAGILTLAE